MSGFRFIHTADWQLGKAFGNFPAETAAELRAARIDVIDTIGKLAVSEQALHVIVAGDVWDVEVPTNQTIRQPLDLMGAHSALTWWLLPGNHDVNSNNRLWERVARNMPTNVRLLLSQEPVEAAPGVWFLPCPWESKFPGFDQTEWLDHAVTPEGGIRIGIAHGSVTDFSSGESNATLIAKTRAVTAKLDYLALGDWHGLQEVTERVWYSGTPEPDRHVNNDRGNVLSVHIPAPSAPAVVKRHRVSKFEWPIVEIDVAAGDLVKDIEERILGGATPRNLIMKLCVRGMIPVSEHGDLTALFDRLGAQLKALELLDEGLDIRVEFEDLDALDKSGSVRKAAEVLLQQSRNETAMPRDRLLAKRALDILFTYHVGGQSE